MVAISLGSTPPLNPISLVDVDDSDCKWPPSEREEDRVRVGGRNRVRPKLAISPGRSLGPLLVKKGIPIPMNEEIRRDDPVVHARVCWRLYGNTLRPTACPGHRFFNGVQQDIEPGASGHQSALTLADIRRVPDVSQELDPLVAPPPANYDPPDEAFERLDAAIAGLRPKYVINALAHALEEELSGLHEAHSASDGIPAVATLWWSLRAYQDWYETTD